MLYGDISAIKRPIKYIASIARVRFPDASNGKHQLGEVSLVKINKMADLDYKKIDLFCKNLPSIYCKTNLHTPCTTENLEISPSQSIDTTPGKLYQVIIFGVSGEELEDDGDHT